MELNGFKIEKYNIHNIPDRAKSHTCPICSSSRKKSSEKCMSVHWESGMGKCNHCGEIIQLHEWAKKTKEKEYTIPKWQNNTELSEKVVKWFESRGIDQFILRLMKIGEGGTTMPDRNLETGWKEKHTVQFPYFRCGNIINIKYRSSDKSFKLEKGAERIPYNIDNIANRETVYWVEGEMDVLAVMQCGIHNVTSPPNGFTMPSKDGSSNINLEYLDNTIDFFKETQKFVLAFDNDEPGKNGTNEFIRRFGAHKCYTVDLKDCKDSNDFLLKYGRDELKKALENFKEIPLQNVSSYKDHKAEVRNFFLHGMPKGLITTTLPELDDCFSVNLGHTVLITGIPSDGKSEVVDQMTCGYALNYDMRIGYASVENKPNYLHLQKLARKLHGYVPKAEVDFNEKFEKVENFMNDHFFFIDIDLRYDLETVLMKAEELVFRKGIKVLVVDPYNKVRLSSTIPSVTGSKINDYTSHYHQRLNEFGYKHNVLILLVAHPVKLEKGLNGKRVIPDFYDVKGGGEHYDMCHHGLTVYRDYQLDCTLIRTLKVKFANLGTSHTDTWWKYNVNNGRYSSIIGDPNSNQAFEVKWNNKSWIENNDAEVKNATIDWTNKGEFEDEECPF